MAKPDDRSAIFSDPFTHSISQASLTATQLAQLRNQLTPSQVYTAMHQEAEKPVNWKFEVTEAENGHIIKALHISASDQRLKVQMFVVPNDSEINVGQHIQAIMTTGRIAG